MHLPDITVMTAACNGERFLARTIESVLNQEFENFEYLILNDASTDATQRIIEDYAKRDKRIIPLKSDTRLEPSLAHNLCISSARGKYIANLDHDDLAAPKRLGLQKEYLDSRPSTGVVGSFSHWINAAGEITDYAEYPAEPALIRWEMMFRGCVLHSAAMMRRDLLQKAGGYSRHHPYACDYELWTRLVPVTDFANIPEYLASYRITAGQTSKTKWKSQQGQVLLLKHALIYRSLGMKIPLQVLNDIFRGLQETYLESGEHIDKIAGYLELMLRSHLDRTAPDDKAAVALIKNSWAGMILKLARNHQTISPAQCESLTLKAHRITAEET